MTSSPAKAVTQLLLEWRSGNQAALDQLMPLVYDELRRLAAHYMRSERPEHTWQATALAKTGDTAGALKNYRQSLAVREALAVQDPANADNRHSASVSYILIGNVLADSGDTAGALQNYRQALAIREKLAASDVTNASFRFDLAEVCARLGEVYSTLASRPHTLVEAQIENWRQAQSWYQRSLDILLDMRNRGMLAGTDADQPDKIFQELAKSKMALAKLQNR